MDLGEMSLPIFYTPITKWQAMIDDGGTQGGRCGQFYMDYMRCASRVGQVRGQYECKRELDDFRECAFMKKQFERTLAMDKERKKQARAYVEPLGKDVPERGY